MGMVGIILAKTTGTTGGATAYYGLSAAADNGIWNSVETRVRQVMPVAGTFSYLRVKSIDPGGSGQSLVFTVRKNAADTALTCTVNTGETAKQDLVNSFSVVAGDLVDMKCVASATAAASTPAWALKFTAANSNEYPLLWAAQAAGTPAGATRYSSVQGDAELVTTEAAAKCVMPTGGVLSKLYVALDANMATAGQVVTLYKNGSPTALTCTVGSGASTANDTSNTVSVAAGDTVSLEWVNSGSNAPLAKAGIKFAPTTDGESLALTSANTTLNQGVTRYNSMSGMGSWSFLESIRQNVLIACELRSLYAVITGIASGQTVTNRVASRPLMTSRCHRPNDAGP